jgi:hypothetical protein
MTDTTTIADTIADNVNIETESFGKETAKTLTSVAVITTVILVGAVVVKKSKNKVIENLAARRAEKLNLVPVVTDLPETETA